MVVPSEQGMKLASVSLLFFSDLCFPLSKLPQPLVGHGAGRVS